MDRVTMILLAFSERETTIVISAWRMVSDWFCMLGRSLLKEPELAKFMKISTSFSILAIASLTLC